jgi:hypothetical protein
MSIPSWNYRHIKWNDGSLGWGGEEWVLFMDAELHFCKMKCVVAIGRDDSFISSRMC